MHKTPIHMVQVPATPSQTGDSDTDWLRRAQENFERLRLERLSQTERNFESWKSSEGPEVWVGQHLQGWNHDDWLELLATLRQSPYWPMDEAAIGQHIEMLREWIGCVGQSVEYLRKGLVEEGLAALDRAEKVRGVEDTALFIRAQAFLMQKKPADAANCLTRMRSSLAKTQTVVEFRKVTAVALANDAVAEINGAQREYRDSVMGQGCAIPDNYPRLLEQARVQACERVYAAISLDPANGELVKLFEKMRSTLKK